jgi:hypothetical protein
MAAKKAAALRISLFGQDLDLASQPAQLLALVAAQALSLAFIDVAWATQFRSEPSETPSSLASCGTARPVSRNSFTASRLNCSEYGGTFGINRHPL